MRRDQAHDFGEAQGRTLFRGVQGASVNHSRATCAGWRHSTQVGLVSALGSISWFAAIALAPVALVRIVGQSEVIFTMWLARFYLKERPGIDEIVGLFLVASGVVLALLGSWWD